MTSAAATVPRPDMEPVVGRLERWAERRSGQVRRVCTGDFDRRAFARAAGFLARGQGQPEIIVGADVALELGHPRTASQSAVLLTTHSERVVHGRVRWLGPDLPELAVGGSHPFAQIVIVAARAGAAVDPFALETAQYLTDRLPGYMVRSVPGRLWVRLSRRARSSGMSLQTVGQALICAYADDFAGVEAVEVLFVTSSAADVESLAPLVTEARARAGQHKKLVLAPDGELECADLDCDSCDEQPVCDSLRDVVIKRRRGRRSESVEAS